MCGPKSFTSWILKKSPSLKQNVLCWVPLSYLQNYEKQIWKKMLYSEQIQWDCLCFRMWKVIWVSLLEVHWEWSWMILTSVLALISTLYSSSLLTTGMFPLQMAWWRAASPLASTMWGSAPCMRRIHMHSKLSRWAACGYWIKKETLKSRTLISIPTIPLTSYPWIRPIV